jgi:hypothetical protein
VLERRERSYDPVLRRWRRSLAQAAIKLAMKLANRQVFISEAVVLFIGVLARTSAAPLSHVDACLPSPDTAGCEFPAKATPMTSVTTAGETVGSIPQSRGA